MRPIFDERLIGRFESKFIPEPNSGCWLWTAATAGKGYGVIGYRVAGKRMEYAHRVSWMLNFGEIPDGMEVCHRCDVPACVNPDHLDSVTNRVNMLRGFGPSAANAAKTACIRGHNDWRMLGDGARECRPCKRMWNRASWRRVRLASDEHA